VRQISSRTIQSRFLQYFRDTAMSNVLERMHSEVVYSAICGSANSHSEYHAIDIAARTALTPVTISSHIRRWDKRPDGENTASEPRAVSVPGSRLEVLGSSSVEGSICGIRYIPCLEGSNVHYNIPGPGRSPISG
jgi:hypothetical protein